ncbi:MAG TPA: SHOCT domain-containing protein [Gallionella sp.]
MWGHMGNYGWGWGGMGFGMGFGMLLFWGLLIAAIVMLVKCSRGSGSCGKRDQDKSALDLLKERYAGGEIERDEFEQKKRDLEG